MIKKQEFFTWRESSSPGEYIIVPKNYDILPFNTKTGGSYAVAPARVLGLSYAQYLRLLMTMFPKDVVVRGKNSIYPIAYWKRDKALLAFIKMLNAKLSLAVACLEDIE